MDKNEEKPKINLKNLEIVLPEFLVQTMSFIDPGSYMEFSSDRLPTVVGIYREENCSVRIVINEARFQVQQNGLKCVLRDSDLNNSQENVLPNTIEDDVLVLNEQNDAQHDSQKQDADECSSREVEELISPLEESNVDKTSVYCELCCEIFENYKKLDKHVVTAHLDNPSATEYHESILQLEKLSCLKCREVFSSSKDLELHLIAKHLQHKEPGFLVYACQTCTKVFQDEESLNSHVKHVHSSFRLKCNQCGVDFKKKAYLQEHVRRVHKKPTTNIFECEICRKVFPTKKVLNRHKKFHDDHKKRFQCTQCQQNFHLKYNLERHVKLVHDAANNVASVCETCGKNFSTESNLRQHVNRVHLNKSPFSCSVCNKGFLRRKCLTIHIKTHETEKTRVKADSHQALSDSSAADWPALCTTTNAVINTVNDDDATDWANLTFIDVNERIQVVQALEQMLSNKSNTSVDGLL